MSKRVCLENGFVTLSRDVNKQVEWERVYDAFCQAFINVMFGNIGAIPTYINMYDITFKLCAMEREMGFFDCFVCAIAEQVKRVALGELEWEHSREVITYVFKRARIPTGVQRMIRDEARLPVKDVIRIMMRSSNYISRFFIPKVGHDPDIKDAVRRITTRCGVMVISLCWGEALVDEILAFIKH